MGRLKHETPSYRRRNHKWAMIGYKGGKCIKCGERVTSGNIERFHFDHQTQVNNHNDKTDRWGGAICDWPPFTEKWFAWAARVSLICQDCHMNKHRQNGQQCLLELSVQYRLDEFEHGPTMTRQLGFDLGTKK